MIRATQWISSAVLVTSAVAVAAPTWATAQSGPTGRPMVPQDLLTIGHFGAITPSPDGRQIAVVIERPAAPGEYYYDEIPRSDVWVVGRDGHGLVNLTHGKGDHSAAWAPAWSPDGAALAFVSTKGGENAWLYVWERRSGRLRRLTMQGVDLFAAVSEAHPVSGEHGAHPIFWLDRTHMLISLLPPGVRSTSFDESTRSIEAQAAGVAVFRRGRESTAQAISSPYDSGARPLMPQARLAVIDVNSGAARTVGMLPAVDTRTAVRTIVVSRSHRFVVLGVPLEPSVVDSAQGWDTPNMFPEQIGVASLTGSKGIRWVPGLELAHLQGGNSTIDLLTWTPTDSAIAAVTTQPPVAPGDHRSDRDSVPRIGIIDPQTATWHPVAALRGSGFEDNGWLAGNRHRFLVAGVAWTTDGRLVLREWGSRAWWLIAGDTISQLATPQDLAGAFGLPITQDSSGPRATDDGRLVVRGADGRDRTLIPALNPHLEAIEEPHYTAFTYVGRTGDTLTATVLLPYGYVPGRRYPMIVRVYAGDVRRGLSKFASRDDDSVLNLLLLAGHGYAVLWPSMPLALYPDMAGGGPSDPFMHLDDGVGPAVDKAIALGIADSTKLGLMGHSYGGYSVYGLVTQTHRYKAAVAMSGITDLVSEYGAFDPHFTYSDPSYAAPGGSWMYEHWQGRMGAPPWVDWDRYVRNSPIRYVDRVTTPLLMVHQDLEIPVQQAEEFFTALNRLGRRSELVRYLGEDHVIESPANKLDVWKRIFRWFDTYVKGDTTANGGEVGK